MRDKATFPAWGEPGTPVLPAAVRECAAHLRHAPLLQALRVDPAAGADAVFEEPLDEPVDPVAVGNAVRHLMNRGGLASAPAMGGAGVLLRRVEPDQFEDLLPLIGWRQRTFNIVHRTCTRESITVYELLTRATFSDLFALRGLGVLTLLDLLGGAENALVQVAEAQNYPAPGSASEGVVTQQRAERARPPAWGEAGSAVLPAVLVGWSSVAPAEVAAVLRALGLPEGTAPGGVFERPADEPFQVSRLGAALWDVIATGLDKELAMGCAAPALEGLDAAQFWVAVSPLLRTRTRNVALREFGEKGVLAFLQTASVTDVMSLRQFGVVSFFDLLVAAEGAAATAADAAATDGADRADVRATTRAEPLQLPECPPWADAVTADDPRFSPLLDGASSLADLFENARPRELIRLRRSVEDAETILRQLDGLPLEQEAASVVRAALRTHADKWLEALGERYGLTGGEGVTLDHVGKALGVTRERVRQVQSRADQLLPRSPVHAPAVDQALELLDWTLPCTGEELAAALAAGGLTSLGRWTASGFRAAVAVTGRAVDIAERDGMIGRTEQLQAAAAVTAAARAVSNAHGIASAATVTRRLAGSKNGPVPQGTVDALLRADPALHWIDTGWFWTDHPQNRNRLVNTSLRILAVNSPQTLDDMLGGVERDFAFRASNPQYADLAAPAAEQLVAFYASHPAFRLLDDGRIESAEPVDVSMLGEEKQALVAVLRAQPYQAMDRLSLQAACDEIGMKRATVTVWTTYAECLKRFGHNVWGLRGADVPPEVVEQLQTQARIARRAVDRTKLVGTTPSGRPWTARRITPSFLYSGVMAFDWGKPELAYRTLAAVDMVDGEPAGQLRFEDNFNWGYSVFLGRHKAQAGQVLRVLADPDADTCYLELGGEELLGEPFDA